MSKGYRKLTDYPQWFIEELVNKEDREKAISGVLPRSQKVLFFCKEHGSYSQTPTLHIDFKTMTQRRGCPVCGRISLYKNKKETQSKKRPEYPEWFINELAYEEDKEKARNKTLTTGMIVDFLCLEHGIYRSMVCEHIKLSTGEKRSGCPICAEIQRRKTFNHTKRDKRPEYPEWFINELAHEEDKERAKDKTLTYSDKVDFLCTEHGIYNQRVADHISFKTQEKKQGCPSCGKIKGLQNRKISGNKKRPDYPEWFINELVHEEDKERARNKTLTWSDYVDFQCPIHGVYNQRIDAHMDTKTLIKHQGCPKCGAILQHKLRKETLTNRRPDYPEWFINELAHEEDKERARNKTLTVNENIDFLCPVHGIYKQYVCNHITISTGQPNCKCPKCGVVLSSNEEEIFNYVKSIYPNIQERDRTVIRSDKSGRPLELDIFCADKKIAIEYNGSLWHSENYKKHKDYHIHKYLMCEKNDIRLISIFDKDWFENKDKIKLFLKDLFSPKTILYGRSVIVKKITNEEVRIFYDMYHLKGNSSGYVVSYGLFYNDELVSAMSFSKPKYGNENGIDWDLSRYSVKYGYSIVGGAEKLFTSFLNEYSPYTIITYSDCDYFNGNVYSRLGFEFVKITDLPYYWAKNNTFFTRQQCQVHKLKEKYPDLYDKAIENEASNKEDFIMHELGYYRVYRCGNKKWIWRNKNILSY